MGENVEERLTTLEIGQTEIRVQQEVLKNVQEQQEKRIAKNEEYREKAIETDYEIKASIKELVHSNKELQSTIKEVVSKVDSMCTIVEGINDKVEDHDEYIEEKKENAKKTISDIKSTFIKRVVEIIIVIIAIALGLAKYL